MKITKVDAIPMKETWGRGRPGPVAQAVDAMEVGEVLELEFDGGKNKVISARNTVYNLRQRKRTKKFRTAVDGNRLYVQRLE